MIIIILGILTILLFFILDFKSKKIGKYNDFFEQKFYINDFEKIR